MKPTQQHHPSDCVAHEMEENLHALPAPPVVPLPTYSNEPPPGFTTYPHRASTTKYLRTPHPNDPVDPKYNLPSAPKRAITPPRFNRDTLNNSDIEFSKPFVKVNTFTTRDNLNKMDPSEQRKRNIYSMSHQATAGKAAERVDKLYVADINFAGYGGGNAAPPYMKLTRRAGMSNPNDPAYVVDTKQITRAAIMHPNAAEVGMPPPSSLYEHTMTDDHYRQARPHQRPEPHHRPLADEGSAEAARQAAAHATLGPIDKSKPPVFNKPLRTMFALDSASIPGAQVGTRYTAPKVHVQKQRPQLLELAKQTADRLSEHLGHALAMRYGQLTMDMRISDEPLYPHLLPKARTAPTQTYQSSALAHDAKQAQVAADAMAARPPPNTGAYANAIGAEYSTHAQPPAFAPVVFTKQPALNPDDSYFPFGKNPVKHRTGGAVMSPASDFHQSTMGSPLAHPEIYPSGEATSKRQALGHLVAELTKADAPRFVPLEPLRPVGVHTDGARTQSHLVSPRADALSSSAALRASGHLVAAKLVAPAPRANPALDAMRASAAASLGGQRSLAASTQFTQRRFMNARAEDISAVRSLRF